MSSLAIHLSLPRGAAAHPLDPALLELRESADGPVAVRWREPASRPGFAALRPLLPASCREAEAPIFERSSRGVTREWVADCGPRGLVGQEIAVDGLRERRGDAVLRVQLADGRLVQAVLRPTAPSLVVPARAGPLAVARSYAALGIEHILSGYDHLLFVLGLVLLVRDLRSLAWTVSAFTIGHSVTLSLAALGWVRFPAAPIEALIAASILALAVEIAWGERGRRGLMARRPWLVAAAFGLLHGLGFAGALADAGLPQGEIPLALASFNAGIEVGQLAFVAVVLAARAALARVPIAWPRLARLAPAYAIGTLAAFWTLERLAAIG